jgi:rod shape-determining protein MreD
MGKYILVLLLIFVSIAQVAWAGFMLIGGYVFPILPIYVWWVYSRWGEKLALTYAFVGGLIVDLLSPSLMGLHAFALLLGIGAGIFVDKRFVNGKRLSQLVTFIIMIGFYLVTIRNLA